MVADDNPLIVQSDRTVLLEVASPRATDARAALARFAELETSPEHIHTYRITPLSLWNAAAADVDAAEVAATLTRYAKYPVPRRSSSTSAMRWPATAGSAWSVTSTPADSR